ncbi:MAG: tRNA guanosine(15) transglycosylase TgtA [archaeon]|nr:MAG: tRNA guanosine(15) transglycosylase TgtA [archaeon]
MGFTFEVKESDGWGRLGSLRVGGKVLETPCLLPVIHPVRQAVPVSELRAMGFEGLMTNSYIMYSRLRQESAEKGIHSLLGFDGVFMTDSGGYQALEYGDLGLSYRDSAAFQSAIGSEFAVTLDRPTGYPQSRGVARETVEYSLSNAKATLADFGQGTGTNWVGPIQGGLYSDLVRASARELARSGFQFLALGSPVQVMESYMFADLVRMIVAAKKAVPYSLPMHLFGAGHPLTTPLAVALGCDTFDSASYILFAKKGRYMTRSGVLALESMKSLPCGCMACSRTDIRDLLDMESAERVKAVAVHNLSTIRDEVNMCREAISEGRLWDLVEEKSMAHPRLREAFREFAKHSGDFVEGTPPIKDRGLFVRSEEDQRRPELVGARARLGRALRPSSGKAVVIERGSGKGLRPRAPPGVDRYLVHPVLGAFPEELEFVYPFTQTVAESEPEGEAKEALKALRAMGYSRVSFGRSSKSKVRSRRTRSGASPSPR